jgi:hypothetical protein
LKQTKTVCFIGQTNTFRKDDRLVGRLGKIWQRHICFLLFALISLLFLETQYQKPKGLAVAVALEYANKE